MSVDLLRQSIVDACLVLSQRGYFAATGGNLSLRVDAKRFLITPSAVDYLAMRPSDVCLLRLDDLEKLEGDRPPSVESGLHAQVLRRRSDVGCCIHTHQPVASALTLLGEDVTVDDEALAFRLGSRIPMVGYAPSGTNWLASKLARAVRPDINAYLLRNHGVVCCGRDIAETVQTIENLEAIAKRLLHDRIAERLSNTPQGEEALILLTNALVHSSNFSASGAQCQ